MAVTRPRSARAWLDRLGGADPLWSLLAWTFGIGLWQLLALGVTAARGVPFPTPWQVALALWNMVRGDLYLEHTLLHHLQVSLARWGQGFVFGLAAGMAYALLAGGWRPLRLVTMPTVEILQLVPGLAWVPVAILIFGLSHASTVGMIAVTAFPPVAIAGVMGVQSVDRRYVRAAKMCGAGAFSVLTTVYLPGALPHALSGVRIGLGASWRVLVAAEMIVGSGDGLGYGILQSRWTMDYGSAFACIAVIALLGLAAERLLLLPLEQRTLQRWGMSHGR